MKNSSFLLAAAVIALGPISACGFGLGGMLGPPTPVADFSAAPHSGPAPLTVNFTFTGENASSYFWRFGDGESSDWPNPTHTYAEPGLYEVYLATSGGGQHDSLTRKDYIHVTASPPPGTGGPPPPRSKRAQAATSAADLEHLDPQFGGMSIEPLGTLILAVPPGRPVLELDLIIPQAQAPAEELWVELSDGISQRVLPEHDWGVKGTPAPWSRHMRLDLLEHLPGSTSSGAISLTVLAGNSTCELPIPWLPLAFQFHERGEVWGAGSPHGVTQQSRED